MVVLHGGEILAKYITFLSPSFDVGGYQTDIAFVNISKTFEPTLIGGEREEKRQNFVHERARSNFPLMFIVILFAIPPWHSQKLQP